MPLFKKKKKVSWLNSFWRYLSLLSQSFPSPIFHLVSTTHPIKSQQVLSMSPLEYTSAICFIVFTSYVISSVQSIILIYLNYPTKGLFTLQFCFKLKISPTDFRRRPLTAQQAIHNLNPHHLWLPLPPPTLPCHSK